MHYLGKLSSDAVCSYSNVPFIINFLCSGAFHLHIILNFFSVLSFLTCFYVYAFMNLYVCFSHGSTTCNSRSPLYIRCSTLSHFLAKKKTSTLQLITSFWKLHCYCLFCNFSFSTLCNIVLQHQ